ncbi:MAG: hypothetical protein ABSH41_07000 [Syntrophobacteraceae bacterium]
MNYLTVPNGKHTGKTIPQIIFNDPDYFFWAIDKKTFFRGELAAQSLDLHLKATQIRIPQNANGVKKVAYYVLHGTERKTFGQIALILHIPTEDAHQFRLIRTTDSD